MPKPYTSPSLYNELKTLSVSLLKKCGYLRANQIQSGTLTWSRNGDKIGSISILVNTQTGVPYLELDYRCNDIPINYRVILASMPSNLGKGLVWYFVCPQTKKHCRKLHLAGNYFYHRSAFNGILYESQTYNKSIRQLRKDLDRAFQVEDILNQVNAPNFKTHYKGVPTKRYRKFNILVERLIKEGL